MKKIAFAFAAAALCASAPALAEDAPAAAGTDTTTTTTAAPDATATTATATTTTTTETTAAPAADVKPMSGLELGLRVGYAIPMGAVQKDAAGNALNLSDVVKSKIPLWLDVGFRVNANFYVGAFASYGIVAINKDKLSFCSNGADCSASALDFGVMAAYHIMPAAQFDPWVGIGIGYESLKSKISAGGKDVGGTVSGLTFANLQLGGDFKVNNNFGIGPFVSLALSQYSSCSNDAGGSCNIDQKALHEWLTIGVKGSYGLW